VAPDLLLNPRRNSRSELDHRSFATDCSAAGDREGGGGSAPEVGHKRDVAVLATHRFYILNVITGLAAETARI
jgi:hypothetical protein